MTTPPNQDQNSAQCWTKELGHPIIELMKNPDDEIRTYGISAYIEFKKILEKKKVLTGEHLKDYKKTLDYFGIKHD